MGSFGLGLTFSFLGKFGDVLGAGVRQEGTEVAVIGSPCV